MSTVRTCFVLGTLLGLLLANPAVSADEAAPDHLDRPHTFVRITEGSLHPAIQTIGASDAFGWINYSSRIARVSFDADVAKKLTCSSRGSFRLTGSRLESGDIQAQQFASLCSLAPGEYRYRVELRAGTGAGGGAPPEAREGTLIVK